MIPDSEDRRPVLSPPRFGISSMLAAVAVMGLMFALLHYVGLLGFSVALFFLVCVLAHIAGNALGTRLRDGGSLQPTGDDAALDRNRRMPKVQTSDFAPATRLRQRSSLGKRNIIITVAGTVAGGILGGLALCWLSGPEPPWSVVALAFGASAVLAGIWTFAAASFVQVMLGAWFHASNESRKR